MRVGMGYDVHKLTENRDLILGGVKIPWEKGLLGHSDADVLLHAVMDALLGAAALGDIGKHFPDTDPKYKGISSVKLLIHVAELLKDPGYEILMQRSLHRNQRWHCIFRRCVKIWPMRLESWNQRSILRQPQKKGLDLPGQERESLLRQSAFSRIYRMPLSLNNTGGKRHETF